MKINPQDLATVIEEALKKFPDEIPRQQVTIEQIHMKIGQQQVINYLLECYERITES